MGQVHFRALETHLCTTNKSPAHVQLPFQWKRQKIINQPNHRADYNMVIDMEQNTRASEAQILREKGMQF